MSSRCLAVHAEQGRAPWALILWAGPPLAAWPMCRLVGIWGCTPHRDHRHTLQTSKSTSTSDSTRETCESQLKTESRPRHQKGDQPDMRGTGRPHLLAGQPARSTSQSLLRMFVPHCLLGSIYAMDQGRFVSRDEMKRCHGFIGP